MSEQAATQKKVFLREISSSTYSGIRELFQDLRSRPRVVKGKDLPWKGKAQPIKFLVPNGADFIQTFIMFIEQFPPGGYSKKHGHQNPACFYILDGEGYDVHDGKRYDWKAGDVVVVSPGCVHQHFNASKEKPATALIMNPKPVYLLAHLLQQRTVDRGPHLSAEDGTD